MSAFGFLQPEILNAGIIRQAPDDVVIQFDKIPQPAGGQIVQNALQFRRRFARFDEPAHRLEREAQGRQLLFVLGCRVAFQFVDGLEEFIFASRISRAALVKFMPRVPAAQANDEVLPGQTEGAQGVDEQRNQLRIRRRAGFADEVGVELEVLAQPAFLLAFVTEQLRYGKPFDGFFVVPLVRSNHTGERRRHLRPERNGAIALVHEVVKLADNFVAAFGREQFE